MNKKRILVAVIATLPLLAQAEQNEKINLDDIPVTAPKIIDNYYATSESSSATRVEAPLKETPGRVQVIDNLLIQ